MRGVAPAHDDEGRLCSVNSFALSPAILNAALRAGGGQYGRALVDFQADAAAYPQLEALT